MLRKPLLEAPVEAPDADLGTSVRKVARKLEKMPMPALLPSVHLAVQGEEGSSSDEEEAAPVSVPMRRKLKAAQPAREEAPAPAPVKERKRVLGPEEYLRKIVEIKIAEDAGNDDNTEQKINELEERGDYRETEEAAIEENGGHSEVVRMMVAYYKKKGLSVKKIVSMFRDVDEGYNMFDDYIAENARAK
jgi:hypothetical protein